MHMVGRGLDRKALRLAVLLSVAQYNHEKGCPLTKGHHGRIGCICLSGQAGRNMHPIFIRTEEGQP